MPKVAKIGIGVIVGYVALVVAFESMIGFLQPQAGAVLVLTTADEDGTRHDRVLSRLESDGKLYVAANHWPRAWYHRALANPDVQVTIDGSASDYVAVPASDQEAARVHREHDPGLVFRFITGFPPRLFVRLDPAPPA